MADLLTAPDGGSESKSVPEDVYAYERFFYGRANGTFLESGAVDGVTGSVTLALERELGWRGVLVEGSARSATQLFRRRPHQVCASVCREVYCMRMPMLVEP